MPERKKKLFLKKNPLSERLEESRYPFNFENLTGMKAAPTPKTIKELAYHLSQFLADPGLKQRKVKGFIKWSIMPAITDEETAELFGSLMKEEDIPEEYKKALKGIYEGWMKPKTGKPVPVKEEEKPEMEPEFVPDTKPGLSFRLTHQYIDEFREITGMKASSIPESPEELAEQLSTMLEDESLEKKSVDSFIGYKILPMMHEEEIKKMIEKLPEKHKRVIQEIIKKRIPNIHN